MEKLRRCRRCVSSLFIKSMRPIWRDSLPIERKYISFYLTMKQSPMTEESESLWFFGFRFSLISNVFSSLGLSAVNWRERSLETTTLTTSSSQYLLLFLSANEFLHLFPFSPASFDVQWRFASGAHGFWLCIQRNKNNIFNDRNRIEITVLIFSFNCAVEHQHAHSRIHQSTSSSSVDIAHLS